MFESLSQGLQNAFAKLTSRGKLTEKNIQDGLREVRQALLEADVNFKVAKDFIQSVSAKAIGEEVIASVRPGQQIVKIVQDELAALMGPVDGHLAFAPKGPTVIMMVGLQGSGKTTSCGKLAHLLKKKGKNPLLVAADVQRPAAIEQLRILGGQIDVPVYFEEGGRPPKICARAVERAEADHRNVVILDTAGRLHIDQELMDELREIRAKVKPHSVYLVCDGMTGQDAVNSAAEFDRQLALDGVILTKLDGDTRGGAALSIKAVTGKPIRFVGVGEKIEEFEMFHPDRMASRILGMGDIVTLVERAQDSVDREEAQEAAEKFLQATFTFEDFLAMMRQVRKMGSVKDLLGMIPGMGAQLGGAMEDFDDKGLTRVEAIITSMTPSERVHPDVIDGSRRQRIARGSGTSVQEVNELLKEFRQMRKMMKGVGGGGLMGRMMGLHRGREAKRRLLPKVQGTLAGSEAFRQFREEQKRKRKERKKKKRRR